jgi:hypothetical protein
VGKTLREIGRSESACVRNAIFTIVTESGNGPDRDLRCIQANVRSWRESVRRSGIATRQRNDHASCDRATSSGQKPPLKVREVSSIRTRSHSRHAAHSFPSALQVQAARRIASRIVDDAERAQARVAGAQPRGVLVSHRACIDRAAVRQLPAAIGAVPCESSRRPRPHW